MSKSATLKVTVSFEDEEAAVQSPTPTVVSCPYEAQTRGSIDVPDGTDADEEYEVPFGAIDTDATLVFIHNRTGQDLAVKINGAAAASHQIKDGGIFVHGAPGLAGATPITAITLITTASQSGAGTVAYRIFGDPAA